MEDMSPEIENLTAALAQLLQDHKGQDVCLLDLRGINNWTDFFLIATVTSMAHLGGLERHIKEFCNENKVDVYRTSRTKTDDQWRLFDLGSIVIHLMTKEAREFYDLERLWARYKHPQNVDE